MGGVKIELLEATSPESPIAKFLEKRGEGVHHLAFDVDDMTQSIKLCEQNGFQMINPEPKEGADDKIIAFLHPKTTSGVLVELCQDKKKEDRISPAPLNPTNI